MRLVFTTSVPGSRDRVCEIPLGDADIPVGEWTYVTIVAEQRIMWRSTITVYLNGIQKFQKRQLYPDTKSMRAYTTRIGGFPGQLGPVVILSRSLMRDEIRDLYSNPSRYSKAEVCVVNTIRYDPTMEYGLNGALHDVHASIERTTSSSSSYPVRIEWLGSWIHLPILKKYRLNIRMAFDARHCVTGKRKKVRALNCRYDLLCSASFEGNVKEVTRSNVGDAFASCGGVWRAMLPLILSAYPPGRKLLPLKSKSPLILRPISPKAFASSVHLLAVVCRNSQSNFSIMHEDSGIRLLICVLKHCSSKMLTLELWWACNELIDAIRFGTLWCDAEGEAITACLGLLSLEIWGRASFEVQIKMWKFILHGVRNDSTSKRNFRDDALKSSFLHHENSQDVSRTFRSMLRCSIVYLRDLLSELQPWGVYGLDMDGNDKEKKETSTSCTLSEKLLLRENLVNVVSYIVKEIYLSKNTKKEHRKNVSDLVHFVAVLIDPSSSSSSSSQKTMSEYDAKKRTTTSSPRRSRTKPKTSFSDHSLFAPLTVLKTLLSTSVPGIIHRVLESLHNVGGMSIFWIALSSSVQDLRLTALKLMRIYASQEKKYGKEWRSRSGRRKNSSSYRESPIGHGEALMIQRCLEPFELSTSTYSELRDILLGRELYGGSEPERFVIWKLASQNVENNDKYEAKFFDSKEIEKRCSELRRTVARCPSMFMVLFELVPKAKTSLQICAFRELAALLTGNSEMCQANRKMIRSNVAWQRWFLYFIVVNTRKQKKGGDKERKSPPPPPKESSMIYIEKLASMYDVTKDIRGMLSEASKAKDSESAMRILQDVVYVIYLLSISLSLLSLSLSLPLFILHHLVYTQVQSRNPSRTMCRSSPGNRTAFSIHGSILERASCGGCVVCVRSCDW